MHPFQPYPKSIESNIPALSDDVEMLQTDVMRFFAILCLCLMAIFALVKALPMSPPAESPMISEPKDLKADAQSLQLQIAALKRKLAESRTQVQAASAASEQASMQAQKAAADKRKIVSQLLLRQRELEAVNRSLNQTRNKLEQSEIKLAGIVNDIDKKQQISSALKSLINNETSNLKKIQTALDRANEKMNKRRIPKSELSQKPLKESPAKKSARDGFVLRFASENALQSLIAGEKVNFYAFAGNKAWQLHLSEGRPGFRASVNPGQIYEMETATVPTGYMTAFQQQVAAFGPTTVTWGVTLPAQTAASINRLVKGQTGGDLVIMPDGEVVLN